MTREAMTGVPPSSDVELDLDHVVTTGSRLAAAINEVIEGKPDVVRTTITVLLAEGHLLVEDVPGVGKTMLAKTLARSIDASVRRVQFTPDLLPSDITGVSIFNQDERRFEFRAGAVFANVVVGDEINRASPKAQSALLEAMEERQVTVDGRTYPLPHPFIILATQNPVEMEGTYPLPEAQRDRFMARVSVGYPEASSEIAMLDHHAARSPLESLRPVTDADGVARMVATVQRVHASEPVRRYIVDLAAATRRHPQIRLGASPRAGLHLLRAARARAALNRRGHVLPDDVQAVAPVVLAHRLLVTSEAQMARQSPTALVSEILQRTPVPGSR